jgi:hypothetical protein
VPTSVALGAFVLGAVLLLVAVLGGNFSIFGTNIPAKIGPVARSFSGVLALAFISFGMLTGDVANGRPDPTPIPTRIVSSPLPSALATTTAPSALPTLVVPPTVQPAPPRPTATPQPAPNPPSEGCPSRPDSIRIPAGFNVTRGPYTIGATTFDVSYDNTYIYTKNFGTGDLLRTPWSGSPNSWIRIQGEQLSYCVNSVGQLFVAGP